MRWFGRDQRRHAQCFTRCANSGEDRAPVVAAQPPQAVHLGSDQFVQHPPLLSDDRHALTAVRVRRAGVVPPGGQDCGGMDQQRPIQTILVRKREVRPGISRQTEPVAESGISRLRVPSPRHPVETARIEYDPVPDELVQIRAPRPCPLMPRPLISGDQQHPHRRLQCPLAPGPMDSGEERTDRFGMPFGTVDHDRNRHDRHRRGPQPVRGDEPAVPPLIGSGEAVADFRGQTRFARTGRTGHHRDPHPRSLTGRPDPIEQLLDQRTALPLVEERHHPIAEVQRLEQRLFIQPSQARIERRGTTHCSHAPAPPC